MNLIEHLANGANIGKSLAAGVTTQIAAEYAYKEYVTVPEYAPKSSFSPNLLSATAGASAIAAIAAPLIGVNRQTAAQMAAAAIIVVAMSEENNSILEPLALIGSAIFTVQMISWAGSFLYNTGEALVGRVRNWIG